MEDQVQALQKLKIPARYLTGRENGDQEDDTLKDLSNKNSKLKLLYLTPEKVWISFIII